MDTSPKEWRPDAKDDKSFAKNTESTVGETARGQTTTKQRVADLETRIGELEGNVIRFESVAAKFESLEKNTGWIQNVVMGVVASMIIVFTVASATIAVEYIGGNQDRYQALVEKLTNEQKAFYTRQEIDRMFKGFKKCLAAGGWESCLVQ